MNAFTREIEDLLRRHLLADTPDSDDHVLHTRSKTRGGLLRLPMGKEKSIIVKIWQARNLKERLKAALGFSNGRREWRMHRMLYQAGVPAPAPLWFKQLSLRNQKYEAMGIEDLGKTTRGLPYLKKLVAAGREAEITSFEIRIIAITEQFIKLRVLDIDHQLNNFVVDASDRLLRLDFECAKRHRFGLMPQAEYVEMISRLLASHIYAVQPDTERSKVFAEHLYACLLVKAAHKKMIQESVNQKMLLQQERKGVVAVVSLPT